MRATQHVLAEGTADAAAAGAVDHWERYRRHIRRLLLGSAEVLLFLAVAIIGSTVALVLAIFPYLLTL